MAADLQGLLAKMIQENFVRELYLYQMPILKTCNNWPAVKEVGRIDFKGKHANYHGGVVIYAEKYYFVPDIRLQALSAFRKWNFKSKVNVVTEKDAKKKKKKNL